MKRIVTGLLAVLSMNVAIYAHGANDHIQGTVSQITDKAITVQLVNKTTKTVTVAGRTTFAKSGRRAGLIDLKVGDRVVIDVEKGKLEALEVKFGPPAAKTAAAEHKH